MGSFLSHIRTQVTITVRLICPTQTSLWRNSPPGHYSPPRWPRRPVVSQGFSFRSNLDAHSRRRRVCWSEAACSRPRTSFEHSCWYHRSALARCRCNPRRLPSCFLPNCSYPARLCPVRINQKGLSFSCPCCLWRKHYYATPTECCPSLPSVWTICGRTFAFVPPPVSLSWCSRTSLPCFKARSVSEFQRSYWKFLWVSLFCYC